MREGWKNETHHCAVTIAYGRSQSLPHANRLCFRNIASPDGHQVCRFCWRVCGLVAGGCADWLPAGALTRIAGRCANQECWRVCGLRLLASVRIMLAGGRIMFKSWSQFIWNYRPPRTASRLAPSGFAAARGAPRPLPCREKRETEAGDRKRKRVSVDLCCVALLLPAYVPWVILRPSH